MRYFIAIVFSIFSLFLSGQELSLDFNYLFPLQLKKGSFRFDIRNSGTSTFGVDSVATIQVGHGAENSVVGFVFDAMNGDFQGLDYGSLYQLDNGDIELKNRSTNDVIIVTSNSKEVRVTSEGDVYIDTPGSGLIMKATSGGSCFKLLVDSAGSLSTQSIACPQ